MRTQLSHEGHWLPARVGLFCGLGILVSGPLQGLTAPPPLTHAAAVRALSHEQAARRLAVRLRGLVIGEAEPDGEAIVLHDGTEGIYLRGPREQLTAIASGDLVEIVGVSDPGGFAPMAVIHGITRLGTAGLPEPRRVSFEQLITGGLDAQWVEIGGIVRTAEPMPGDARKTKLELASGGGRLHVQVHARLLPAAFVDAEVRLRGICFNQHNTNRQVLDPLLLVPRGVPLIIERRPPDDPLTAPPQPIGRLLQFAPQGTYGHRVHVRGVVTHQRLGEFLWIRDGGRGLRVQSRQREAVTAGDEVDALGFPARGEYTPVLEDAVFRKRAPGAAPAPVRLTSPAAVLRHDADLVEIDARLIGVRPAQDGWILVLDWSDSPIEAFVATDDDGRALPSDWRAGSLVRVAGICAVTPGDQGPLSGLWEPRSFRILLRSMGDLRVVEPPPWWTKEWASVVFAAVALTSLVALVAVGLAARRRLRAQSVRRAMAEREFSAILTERNRIAREIHDTLAQDLAAISMHLEVARNDSSSTRDGKTHLEIAHRLVRESLAGARQSIWNMRSQVLERQDLAGAIHGLVRQLAGGTGIDAQVEVSGTGRRLPPTTENNLLRIAQEAIVNAIKHARASRIEVRLAFADRSVQLTVRDDGEGFDAARPSPSDAAFGLLGMRERAAQVGSTLILRSAPDRGTEVSLCVPVPGSTV